MFGFVYFGECRMGLGLLGDKSVFRRKKAVICVWFRRYFRRDARGETPPLLSGDNLESLDLYFKERLGICLISRDPKHTVVEEALKTEQYVSIETRGYIPTLHYDRGGVPGKPIGGGSLLILSKGLRYLNVQTFSDRVAEYWPNTIAMHHILKGDHVMYNPDSVGSKYTTLFMSILQKLLDSKNNRVAGVEHVVVVSRVDVGKRLQDTLACIRIKNGANQTDQKKSLDVGIDSFYFVSGDGEADFYRARVVVGTSEQVRFVLEKRKGCAHGLKSVFVLDGDGSGVSQTFVKKMESGDLERRIVLGRLDENGPHQYLWDLLRYISYSFFLRKKDFPHERMKLFQMIWLCGDKEESGVVDLDGRLERLGLRDRQSWNETRAYVHIGREMFGVA